MSTAINNNDVTAFASLYGMYQDALSQLSKNNTADANVKLSDTQRRAYAAENSLDELEQLTPDFAYTVSNIPLVGNIATLGGNTYDSAANSLATQIGYMLSGANIKEEEAQRIGQSYVPQPLDNENPANHIACVTSETSPLAASPDYLAAFFMDDYIGGRFSSSSGVGGCVLSLAFGPEVFADFLNGAAEADKLAKNADLMQNPALLDALIGVYERNVLMLPNTAVLPYSQALSRFPAHLQQLDMESNGKSVNRFGEPVNYVTGPIIFGEPGTNGQHSFYQLLHQGTGIVPLQFVGYRNSQMGSDVVIQGSTSQQKLCANVAAQIVAFACGKDDADLNKKFEGGRPSSIIIGDKLTPASLGALLAHFENKVMFQGFAWNINSFDQEGVQLGKVLAKKVLAHDTDGALKVYSDLLNI